MSIYTIVVQITIPTRIIPRYGGGRKTLKTLLQKIFKHCGLPLNTPLGSARHWPLLLQISAKPPPDIKKLFKNEKVKLRVCRKSF